MARTHKKEAGVSAVLGTVIGLLVFFTIVIPMWVYMQQLQTMYMDSVNRRLIFEAEKLREKLDMSLTLSSAADSPGQYQPVLNITNSSPIETTVQAIYIESTINGVLRASEQPIILAPGERSVVRLNYQLQPNELIRVRLATARGNSFVSPYEIGPKKLPYLLMISLTNLSVSSVYRVRVATEGDGCVLPSSSESSLDFCRAELWVKRYVEVRDLGSSTGRIGREEVFVFNVAPGRYNVMAEVMRNDGSWAAIIPLYARSVVVDSHVLLRFNVTQHSWPLILRITNPVPRLIIFNTTNTPTALVNISFVLAYDSAVPGPTLNATVRLDPVGFTCSSPLEVRISRLNPGDSASAVFICEVPYSPPTNYRYVLHVPEGSIEVPGSFTVDTSDPRTSLTTTGYIDVCLLRRETLVRSLSVTTSTITINTVVVPVVSIETIQTTEIQALECGG
jgi:hypothetical protein